MLVEETRASDLKCITNWGLGQSPSNLSNFWKKIAILHVIFLKKSHLKKAKLVTKATRTNQTAKIFWPAAFIGQVQNTFKSLQSIFG